MTSIYSAIQSQARLTDEVIVSFSGGKESVVTLDLCFRYFKRVHAFFMYYAPGLSFQEAVLQWHERKYGIEIYRMPHWELSLFYRSGSFVNFDPTLPVVSIKDVYEHVRGVFNTHWIAAGERAKDSVVRGAMIKKSGSIDKVRGRFFPLAYWDKEQVLRYCEDKQLKYGAERAVFGRSFGDFKQEHVADLKKWYPDDYEKLRKVLPLLGVLDKHYEMYGRVDLEKRHAKDAAP